MVDVYYSLNYILPVNASSEIGLEKCIALLSLLSVPKAVIVILYNTQYCILYSI